MLVTEMGLERCMTFVRIYHCLPKCIPVMPDNDFVCCCLMYLQDRQFPELSEKKLKASIFLL